MPRFPSTSPLMFGQQMKTDYQIDGMAFGDFTGFVAHFNAVVFNKCVWNGNLDALNDILYGGFGTPDEGFSLTWRNSDTSRKALGYGETALWLMENLQRCHPSNRPRVQSELNDAQNNQGNTLFDIIVEIIRGHKDIDLIMT